MFLHSKRFLLAFLLTATVFFSTKPSSISAVWQQPPHEFVSLFGSNVIALASDANGHAFVVFGDFDTNSVLASYYTSGTWSTPVVIGSEPFMSRIEIAMDDSGTALVIWYDVPTGNILTANFDGSSWNTPNPSPLDTLTVFSATSLAISMNGPNEGVAMWIDSTTTLVRSSFFSSGTWTAPTTIGNGFNSASIDYSANGTVVAGWNYLGATVSNYTGGNWQLPTILDATATSGSVVGIDSNGNALAVWDGSTGNIVSSRFNGTTLAWSTPQNISLTSGNSLSNISVAPGGTAVATWVNSSLAGESSSFNGSVWNNPIQFSAGPISNSSFTNRPKISVNNSGDALVVFYNTANEIKSARLPLAGVWAPEEFIAVVDPMNSLRGSLSSNGTGFAAWVIPSEGSAFFASATLPTPPPSNLRVRSCKNKFATQTDRVNIITFDPSVDTTIVSYSLSRNGVVIATIPSTDPYVFADHNRCKGVSYTYSLVAVGAGDVESASISIIVN